MKFGLYSMSMEVCSRPQPIKQVAQLAEAIGFESLWVTDHIALPDPPAPHFQVDPKRRHLDPLVTLGFLAGITNRVKLGTGVIVLPQRNPVVLAKQLVSLDELSAGRLIFGLGVGHLEPEFRATGAVFNQRGARTDEYLAAMQSLWRDAEPAYQGKYVSFANVQAQPQREIVVVVGGHSPAALRRALTKGQGWYGVGLTPDQTADYLSQLSTLAQEVERPAELGQLEISVAPREPITPEVVAQFETLGVGRLILRLPNDVDESGLVAFVEQIGRNLINR